MNTRSRLYKVVVTSATVVVSLLAACSDERSPVAPILPDAISNQANSAPAPAGVVNVTIGSGSLSLWPFTGVSFSGTPQDPINLIFAGNADPRQIRASLMSLSGTGRPGPLAGITCTWDDAVGDPQTNYADAEGWVGSAIQLECNNFYGPRFHLRMFRQGNVTVANAHYEILIPGTNTHEVLSWEFAEQFITADMARTGSLVAAPAPTSVITPAPFYRAVQPAIVAGLSAGQIAALGLSVNGDGSASIPSDGRATILTLGTGAPITTGIDDKDFVITFGQIIPKPFCVAGTTGYLYASGPIRVQMHSGIAGNTYKSEWTGRGTLTLVQFNPSTGQPVGSPYQGEVNVRNSTELNDGKSSVEFKSDQREVPDVGTTRGSRVEHLRAREEGKDEYSLEISC